MRVKKDSVMTWDDAPDTITPKDLSDILGIGIDNARKIFKEKDFPNISASIIGNIGKADKEAARLYIQGIRIKNNTKEDIFKLIYLELKMINDKLDPKQSYKYENKEIDEKEKLKFEKIWLELNKFGIRTEKELDDAINKMKLLNIGCFVNEVPKSKEKR